MPIQRAVRTQRPLRIGFGAPTGAGKTLTALIIGNYIVEQLKAQGKNARLGVIDTENHSASVYSPAPGAEPNPAEYTFDFDVISLSTFAPDTYVTAIEEFEKAPEEYVLIVDSVSHAWIGKEGALEQVDKAQGRGVNKFTAWRDVSPQHSRLVDKLINYQGHLIATLRSKMEYALEKNDEGKNEVKKLGLAPQMRDGLEYEFDHYFEIDQTHNLYVSKTRAAALDGYAVHKPGLQLAEKLWTWATGNGAQLAPEPERPFDQLGSFRNATTNGINATAFMKFVKDQGLSIEDLAAVAKPADGKSKADITAWLQANPKKTLLDLVDEVKQAKEAKAAEADGATQPVLA